MMSESTSQYNMQWDFNDFQQNRNVAQVPIWTMNKETSGKQHRKIQSGSEIKDYYQMEVSEKIHKAQNN